MNGIFVRKFNEGEFHSLLQGLREDPVKHRQYFLKSTASATSQGLFGFRAADVTSVVNGNGDNNREAWDMGQKLPP
jgi:hypothetical protein